MATEAAGVRRSCPRCDSVAPHLFTLPAKVITSLAAPPSACYFCFLRIVGIKPTRRQRVAAPAPLP